MFIWKAFSALTVFVFYGLLFVVPIVFGFQHLAMLDAKIFSNENVLSALKFTFFQASLSVLLSVLVGFILFAVSFERVSERARTWTLIPFVSPVLLIIQTAVLFFGRNGWFGDTNWIYSWEIVVLLHVWINAPWFFSLMHEGRLQISHVELEAAALSGASRTQRLFQIALPQLKSVMIEGVTSIFSFTAMSYSIVVLLGGGPPVETLVTQILFSVRGGELRMDEAIVCAFYQSLLTVFVVLVGMGAKKLIQDRPIKRSTVVSTRVKKSFRVFSVFFVLVWIAPLAVFLFQTAYKFPSILNTEFAERLTTSFFQTVFIAGVVALVSLVLTVSALYWSHFKGKQNSWMVLFFLLPPSFSSLTLGILAWDTWSQFVSPLEYGFIYFIGFQIVFTAPVGVRMLKELVFTADRSTYEAARVFGASPFQAFWISEVPRLAPVAFQFMGVAFAFSLGELALLHLFLPRDWEPLPSLIANLNAHYHFDEASGAVLALSFGVVLGLGASKILSSKFSRLA